MRDFARPVADSLSAQAMMRYDAGKKSAGIAYLLWFFLGWLGVHRFYLGRLFSGVLMLLLSAVSTVLTIVVIGHFGLFLVGVWWLVDALLIPGMTRAYNERLIARLTR